MASQQHIGVCYSGQGNNLPTKQEVAEICRRKNITRMRIYDPNPAETLQALRGLNMEILLDLGNEFLQEFTFDKEKVNLWFQSNVQVFFPGVKVRYICVGNEVQPTDRMAACLLPAMKLIQEAIQSAGLQREIKVTTAIDSSFLVDNVTYPSQCSFRDDAKVHMQNIINFLLSNQAPLLANLYPYNTFIHNRNHLGISYALFTGQGVGFRDAQIGYKNLFDDMLDSLYSAVEKAQGQSLEIVVSKTGWPSDGGLEATNENAGTFYRNLIQHVKGAQGTSKRAFRFIETYLFAMFDVNQTEGDGTKSYGLFYPNKEPKYNGLIFF